MMDTIGIIVGLITALCTTGGIIYLVVEKLFSRKQDREDVKHQQVENKKETIEYGITMVSIYNEIDKIVESKTAPIQDKLDQALTRIDNLEENWCCWREDCPQRIRSRKDAVLVKKIKSVADEAINSTCKH